MTTENIKTEITRDDLKEKLGEIQARIEEVNTEMSSLHGMLNVLRGVREDSEFDVMDLCECFVNLAVQVERIQDGMLSPAIGMIIKLDKEI